MAATRETDRAFVFQKVPLIQAHCFVKIFPFMNHNKSSVFLTDGLSSEKSTAIESLY